MSVVKKELYADIIFVRYHIYFLILHIAQDTCHYTQKNACVFGVVQKEELLICAHGRKLPIIINLCVAYLPETISSSLTVHVTAKFRTCFDYT